MSKMKRSEKGLLTPDNCVVALIDHQQHRRARKGVKSFSSTRRSQHGGKQEFQRKYLAANQGCLSEPSSHRAYFDGCLGRQELCCRYRKERQEKNRVGRTLDGNLRGAANYPGHSRRLRNLRGRRLLRRR